MRGLVVDPSPTLARIATHVLHASGCEDVVHVRSGAEALQVLGDADAGSVGIVLTEWDLPGDNGIDLVNRIRGTEGTATVPIVMATARNSRAEVLQAVEAGVTAYVLKPLDPDLLRDHIVPILAPLLDAGDDGAEPASTESEPTPTEATPPLDQAA